LGAREHPHSKAAQRKTQARIETSVSSGWFSVKWRVGALGKRVWRQIPPAVLHCWKRWRPA